jgi:hypothetical protein
MHTHNIHRERSGCGAHTDGDSQPSLHKLLQEQQRYVAIIATSRRSAS